MPRGRILKPEVFNSEQVAEAGELALVQLQGLWLQGDDHGVHPAQAFALCRATIGLFGHGADETRRRIEVLRAALDRSDSDRNGEPLVYEYEAGGARYWLVPGFIRQNGGLHKPSYRHPLPEITDDSPAWLKNWARENAGVFGNVPPGPHRASTGRPPGPRQEAEAEAEADKKRKEAEASEPRPADTPRARDPEPSQPGGLAGRGKSLAGSKALAWVSENLDASDAKIRDQLADDPALALAVRDSGGWANLVAAMRADPIKAGSLFGRRFGQACQELRGKRAPPGGKRAA